MHSYMKPYSPFKRFCYCLALIFLRPLFMCWCWDYLSEDLSLPDLGYWKLFWLMFAVGMFFPTFYSGREEFFSSRVWGRTKLFSSLALVLTLAGTLPCTAKADTRSITVQPVIVNLSGDLDVEAVKLMYAQAAELLSPTIRVVFEEPIEVFAYCPIGEKRDLNTSWHAALCPSFASPGRILMVLDPRSYTIGTIRGTCVLERECPTIVVQFNPADLLAAAIATAHEIGHGGGATHDPSCSLMSSRALVCGKRGARLSSRSKAQIRACFRRSARVEVRR